MLSVYLHDQPHSLSFRLVGELDWAGAAEFAQTWDTAASTLGPRTLTVDLSEVIRIDDHARRVLTRLAASDARFITANGIGEAAAAEILHRTPSLVETGAWGWRLRLWCRLGRCCRHAVERLKGCLPCWQTPRKIW